MTAKQCIQKSHKPLHQRELHPEYAIACAPVISSRMEDIEILFIKIIDG